MNVLTLLWLIAGSALCLVELFVPTAFVAFMMGISALLVAVVALVIPQFTITVALWLGLSAILIFFVRERLMPRRRSSLLQDAQEAETLTEILPGKGGRVRYEGNSWRAICADEGCAIAPHQNVYVVRREGNTLIVLPRQLLE
jgi:membrane protein implicated in regulation of membrane protease activity